jgi:uncharacterized membrane protein YhaH (DUF805 family)
MSIVIVTIGFLVVLFSVSANAFVGTQIALIGIACLLIGLFIEVRRLADRQAK